MKSPPWADGKESQEIYHEAVKQWKKFHDTIVDTNSKILLQGMVLVSQLYGRARDLAKKVSETEIESVNGELMVASEIHKMDALYKVTDVYERFPAVISTKRSENESLKIFETRFDAQMVKLNSMTGDMKIPDSLVSIIILNNSNIEKNQRVTVLASCSPKGDHSQTGVLEAIKYEEIASILSSLNAPQNRKTRKRKVSPISRSTQDPRPVAKLDIGLVIMHSR